MFIFFACVFLGICIFWDNIWNRHYYASLLLGEIKYGSKTFVIYDFSKYEEKGVVGICIGIPQTKEDIFLEAFPGFPVENANDIILDNFYVKGAIIPQNRITKRFGKYKGEMKAWIQ